MRSSRAASIAALLLAPVIVVHPARAQVPPLAPDANAAVAVYLRDPVGTAQWFLDTARAQPGPMHPVLAVLAGDAALRTGRYRWATEYFESVRDSGQDPKLTSTAEIGLAWAALGRGRLGDAFDHFANAGALNEQVRSLTDVALALVAAADGAPDGGAALSAAAASAALDPALRDIAPLLDAYARLWSGDAAGAADAFTAFAVAHPDSRFADDALYAAAQAKQRTGRGAEAQADLEALAGDERMRGRRSSRLAGLDGKALLREGMRRDREMPTRLLPQRLADLLDGDGGRLARAALAAREHPAIAANDHSVPAQAAQHAGGGAQWTARARPDAVGAADGDTVGASRRRAGTPGVSDAAGSDTVPRGAARFGWMIVLAAAALLAAVALWLVARDRTQVRSR